MDPRELLEVERVAAREAVHRRPRVADERDGVGLAQRPEAQDARAVLGQRAGERRRRRRGHAALAHRQAEQDGRRRRPPDEGGDRVGRRGVGPVDVVQADDERPRRREPLEEIAERAVDPVAVRGHRGRAERGQQRRERAGVREPEPCDPALAGRGEMRVQRLAEHAVRQVGLVLGRARRQHRGAVRRRERRELGQQPRLPDPGLALDRQHAARALPRRRHRGGERRALRDATDERDGRHAAGGYRRIAPRSGPAATARVT